MNSESMPPELDVFISLLGEIDMLKGQVSVLDKNTHIALSQSDTSAILGNAECFRIQTDLPDVIPHVHILRSSSPEIVGYDLLDLRLLRHVPLPQDCLHPPVAFPQLQFDHES